MTLATTPDIIYPDSDGQPMADNTKQFNWIVLLKENLECLFANDPHVFVGGDLLWYPVEGQPEIRIAPDVLVALGRPKGDRGSYRQWQEDNVAPQVVFEILSPGNTLREMTKKLHFYERYGVEEYYIYDPDRHELTGLERIADKLELIDNIEAWTSPRLGIRFDWTPETLKVYYPDGKPFLSTVELAKQAEAAQMSVIVERERAELEKQRADQAEAENLRLLELLRKAGIEP
ncbi:Uma2 family endonuclease [Thermosynechococcaceae cyanobacterium BACA0444]|uniref:Uma2 family endonuclease n=1 Tax=Pseudocalidococcus azoricus BACA0444 TaxID=2918990 RepID=A0AAE4FP45_9CYAN|nr:Uma2 family endonuclease [Pseudocalidococcus azoricus]MDS3859520.1 Uma2 family endonuclease [Pseudocalidococcus azoricus BACA0444]